MYQSLTLWINKNQEGQLRHLKKNFSLLFSSWYHAITSPLSRLHAPPQTASTRQNYGAVVQVLLNQVSEHTPASSILSGVAFVKRLSASQEPRKTLSYGKALKWGTLRHRERKWDSKYHWRAHPFFVVVFEDLGGIFRSHGKFCSLFLLVMHLPASPQEWRGLLKTPGH